MPAPLFGAGFRASHGDAIRSAPGSADWLEVVSDHYLGVGGPRRARLAALRRDHPILLHGVSLSIAGSAPLSESYLRDLRALADWLEPLHVSDHLCWTALGGHQSHDLLPIAYTEEVLEHVAQRVERVQTALARPILLENPSAYVSFAASALSEAEFLAELCRRTGCGILLDLNNLYVNHKNLDQPISAALEALPAGAVGYFHLAGHAVLEDVRIDTHDAAVPEPVWELYASAARRFPSAGTIVEWDDRLPPWAVLAAEVERARRLHRAAREPLAAAARTRAPRAPAEPRAARGAQPWSELQRDLFARVVDKPLGFDHAGDPELAHLLDDALPVRAARGLRVYSDAYTASLREALAVNFPTLARVLRAADFDALASRYLRAHPPRGHGFAALGRELSDFLRAHPLAGDYGVEPLALAELAALEQAQIEVCDAPDAAEALEPAALAQIEPEQWEGARFGFTGALRILHAGHDLLPAVEAEARGEAPPRPERVAVSHLVCRGSAGLRCERLEPAQAAVLEALVAGRSFGDACAAARWPGADEAELAALSAGVLLRAVSLGLVCELRLPRAPAQACA